MSKVGVSGCELSVLRLRTSCSCVYRASFLDVAGPNKHDRLFIVPLVQSLSATKSTSEHVGARHRCRKAEKTLDDLYCRSFRRFPPLVSYTNPLFHAEENERHPWST